MSTITKKQISEELLHMGVNPALLGFKYLRDGISIALEDPSCIHSITNILYPKVGEQHNTTGARVERGMRHAIERAFDTANDNILSYFGPLMDPRKGKVTNTTFIAGVCELLKSREREGNV